MTCFQENLLTLKSMHIPFLVYIKKLQNLSADIEYVHSFILYDRPVHLNLTSDIRIQQTSPHIKIHLTLTLGYNKPLLTLTLRYNKPLLTSRYNKPLLTTRYNKPLLTSRYNKPLLTSRYNKPLLTSRYSSPLH